MNPFQFFFQVNIQCIESKQGALIWRAIHVHPESFNDDRRQEPRFTHNNKGPLYAPKNGVSVSLLTKNLSVNLGATLDLEVIDRPDINFLLL